MNLKLDLSQADEIILLNKGVHELELKVLSTTLPAAIKSSKVRELFGNMSRTELYSLINNGILKPFKLYEGGFNYFKTEEVLRLIPK